MYVSDTLTVANWVAITLEGSQKGKKNICTRVIFKQSLKLLKIKNNQVSL